MNYLSLATLFFLFNLTAFGQELNKNDSLQIAFKAKLLTVSEYGIADKSTILKDIENQKVLFLETQYENFLFLKVDFSQPRHFIDGSISVSSRTCSFFLSFNKQTSRFYKLIGFDFIDIDSFIKDLGDVEKVLFGLTTGKDMISEIDINLLFKYHESNKRKRRQLLTQKLKSCRNHIYSSHGF